MVYFKRFLLIEDIVYIFVVTNFCNLVIAYSWFMGKIHKDPYANCEPYTAKSLDT